MAQRKSDSRQNNQLRPQDYKGKLVYHSPSNETFLVDGGGCKDGRWYLRDKTARVYALEECQLVDLKQLEFDVRKLKQVCSIKELNAFFEARDHARLEQAWNELEKEPIEAAAVAILYCDTWLQFLALCDGYGVSAKQSVEANRLFRDRLEQKGLKQFVQQLHNDYIAQQEGQPCTNQQVS